MRSSDIYIQTSLTEGFSNAIVQAMATGLPVVATNVGGNTELIGCDCGKLVCVGDIQATYEALKEILDNTELQNTYARQKVEKFCSIDVMVEKYMKSFEFHAN